jgi:ssDNA-binding replication factor A large subunit
MENTNTAEKEPIVLKKPTFITMKDLQPGTRVTMHLKVSNIKVTRERKRYEGTVNKNADCLVGDEYGCAILIAKDEQLNLIKEGGFITIRNAHANVVKEHMRIEIDRWAKVEVSANDVPKVKSINTTNNLSEIEYELVPVNK